jgi:hypothetical protein
MLGEKFEVNQKYCALKKSSFQCADDHDGDWIESLEKVVHFGKSCEDETFDSAKSLRFLLVYGDELFVMF